jgi:hypothetical protein
MVGTHYRNTRMDRQMSIITVYSAAAMLPTSSSDSLLGTVFICSVVLGAALLYSLSIDRRS